MTQRSITDELRSRIFLYKNWIYLIWLSDSEIKNWLTTCFSCIFWLNDWLYLDWQKIWLNDSEIYHCQTTVALVSSFIKTVLFFKKKAIFYSTRKINSWTSSSFTKWKNILTFHSKDLQFRVSVIRFNLCCLFCSIKNDSPPYTYKYTTHSFYWVTSE